MNSDDIAQLRGLRPIKAKFRGQEATVLQLPAQPATAAEAKAQERVAYVG
jgi:hypothetical protein